FLTVIQPALLEIFDAETEFKSQDFRQMTSALEVVKTFDLVSDENLSREAKREIIARVFDLDPDKEKKALEAEQPEREERERERMGQFGGAPGETPDEDDDEDDNE